MELEIYEVVFLTSYGNVSFLRSLCSMEFTVSAMYTNKCHEVSCETGSCLTSFILFISSSGATL